MDRIDITLTFLPTIFSLGCGNAGLIYGDVGRYELVNRNVLLLT